LHAFEKVKIHMKRWGIYIGLLLMAGLAAACSTGAAEALPILPGTVDVEIIVP
jgi:hypothetical protein